jgi:hypothetical protein
MPPRAAPPPPTGLFSWAGTVFAYKSVEESAAVQEAPAVREGPEGSRAGRQGVVIAKIASMIGGLVSAWFKTLNWTQDLDKYVYSQGLWSHAEKGGLYKPYLLQLQASITGGEDISGKLALNQRVSGLNTSIGAALPRFYMAFGTKFWTETSTTDHSLLNATAPTLADNELISFTCMREGIFASVREVVVGGRWHKTAGVSGIYMHTTITPAGAGPTWLTGETFNGTADRFNTLWGFELLDRHLIGYNLYYYSKNAATAGINTATLGTTLITEARGTAPTAMTDGTNALALPDGGICIGRDPTTTGTVYFIVPKSADPTGNLITREVVKLVVGTPPVGTLTRPRTTLNNVVGGCFYLGGQVFWGDESSNGSLIATRCVVIESDGTPREINIPETNGSKPWGIRSGHSQGRYLILHMVYIDGTDAGICVYVDQTFHVSWPLFSMRATNSGTPLAWAGPDMVSVNLRRTYAVVPNTTNTDVYRTFVPVDLGADPSLVNVTEKRHYGSSYLQTAVTNRGGPEEANKAWVQRIFQGRQISTTAAATFGTVTVVSGLAGSAGAFASGSNLFTKPYEVYNPPGGIGFVDMADRITLSDGLANEAAALAWPAVNGLPYLDIYDVQWPLLRTWTFVIDWPATLSRQRHWGNFVRLLKVAINVTVSAGVPGGGKPSGVLILSTDGLLTPNTGVLASLENFHAILAAVSTGVPEQALIEGKVATMTLRELPGSAA